MESIFSRTEQLLGGQAMQKLAAAHVAVIGLGGVGSWCAEALWRSGVGRLTLMDFDIVAPSNLNRQAQALRSTLGQDKAAALAERLRDIDDGREITLLSLRYTPEEREALFVLRPDYIADCIDSVKEKTDLIREAKCRTIPILSALGTGGKTDASLLRVGDIAKTDTCPLARAMRRSLRAEGIPHADVVWSPEPAAGATEGKPGTVMWVPAAAGLLMAQEIIKKLTEPAAE